MSGKSRAKTSASLLVALVLLAAASRGRAQAAPDPAHAMDAISWLAGDWEPEGKSASASGATPKVVYRFRSILAGRALSVETTFNGAGRFQGIIGYDPARKSVAVWYLTVTGDSTTGTMTETDGTALFDLTTTGVDGRSSHLQLHIVHVDADHYRWEIYTDSRGAGMTKLFETVYHRLK